MTAIIEKLRRKRKVSSELHARWGDVSISYPTEGSWSQCQSPGGAPSAMPARPSEQSRRHGSLDALDRPAGSSRMPTPLRSGDRKASVDSAMTIPTGHYDARLRGRSKTKPPYPHSPRAWEEDSDECSADEDEEEDVPSALGGSRGRYHHYPHSSSRVGGREEDPYARASKSPPLSVTSRMRRCSVQSTATEPTTMPTTASSKHSSFASSVPSVPSEEPRLYHAVHQDKKPQPPTQQQQQPRRARPREAESASASARQQELVPSYDELYG